MIESKLTHSFFFLVVCTRNSTSRSYFSGFIYTDIQHDITYSDCPIAWLNRKQKQKQNHHHWKVHDCLYQQYVNKIDSTLVSITYTVFFTRPWIILFNYSLFYPSFVFKGDIFSYEKSFFILHLSVVHNWTTKWFGSYCFQWSLSLSFIQKWLLVICFGKFV